MFPILLIVGIRYGIFTPSEAGAFAVAYAIFVGMAIYRELTLELLLNALRHSVSDIGMIMLIIMLSSMIGYMITLEGVPQAAASVLVGITENKIALMLLLIAFIILLGMFLEATVIVLLLTPILMPIIPVSYTHLDVYKRQVWRKTQVEKSASSSTPVHNSVRMKMCLNRRVQALVSVSWSTVDVWHRLSRNSACLLYTSRCV